MQHYDSQSRQAMLDTLTTALSQDERIAGVLLVGSASYNFKDQYSDLDLSVVVHDNYDALTIFDEWEGKIRDILPVLWRFKDIRGDEVGLYAIILTNFLEIDISFVSRKALSANSPDWKIIFDHTGQLESIQQQTWKTHQPISLEQRYHRYLDPIWHYITHIAVAIKRDQLWRAIYYFQEMRNRAIELDGLLDQLQTRHFREIDQLPAERLQMLEQTIIQQLDGDSIFHALEHLTTYFFDVASHIDASFGNDHSQTLRTAMQHYLDLMKSDDQLMDDE